MSILSKSIIFGAAIVAASLAAGVEGANASIRHVTLVNNSDEDLVGLYASNVGAASRREDVLGDVLKSGHRMKINMHDGSGYCRYDFRAVFGDGTVLVRRGVNVCKVPTFTYY